MKVTLLILFLVLQASANQFLSLVVLQYSELAEQYGLPVESSDLSALAQSVDRLTSSYGTNYYTLRSVLNDQQSSAYEHYLSLESDYEASLLATGSNSTGGSGGSTQTSSGSSSAKTSASSSSSAEAAGNTAKMAGVSVALLGGILALL